MLTFSNHFLNSPLTTNTLTCYKNRLYVILTLVTRKGCNASGLIWIMQRNIYSQDEWSNLKALMTTRDPLSSQRQIIEKKFVLKRMPLLIPFKMNSTDELKIVGCALWPTLDIPRCTTCHGPHFWRCRRVGYPLWFKHFCLYKWSQRNAVVTLEDFKLLGIL